MYRVDGVVYDVRPAESPREPGHDELEDLIRLLYLRGPGVTAPGEQRPRYCLRGTGPELPAGPLVQLARTR